MAEPIVFKLGLTPDFRIARCIKVPAGGYYDLPPAPEDAQPVEGSASLVACPEILMVTAGTFDMIVPEAGTITLHAGDMGSPQRYRSALRLVATQDDSAYVCITPRDNSFWEREAVFVPAGQSIALDPVACEAEAVLVATGGLKVGATDYGVGALTRLENGRTFTATQDSYFIHLWKP